MDYIFLKPVARGKYHKRDNYVVLHRNHTSSELEANLRKLRDEVIHFDFETQGLDALSDEQVVSCSFATSTHLFVCDARDWTDDHWKTVLSALSSNGAMAYTSNFDFRWLYRASRNLGGDGSEVLNAISGCTLTLFRMLANERYIGQTYNLGDAQDFLSIPSNKVWLKEALEKHKLKKGDMWRLIEMEEEYDNFLKYNMEDADVSYILWQELCSQLQERDMEYIISYHQNEVVLQIAEMIEQWWDGLKIDVDALSKHHTSLRLNMAISEGKFRTHHLSKEYIDMVEDRMMKDHYIPTITKKRVWAKKADNAPLSPQEWHFHPEVKPIAKWEEEIGGRFCKYEYSVSSSDKPAPLFNLSSGDQLRDLFFNHLYSYEVYEQGKRRMCNMYIGDRKVSMRLTKAAQHQFRGKKPTLPFDEVERNALRYLPLSSDTYPILGELGQLLHSYVKSEKEAGYVKKCLERAEKDGRIHLDFIPNGTMTGRANGAGGYNFLQQPKTPGYMSCMVPDDGMVLISQDINGLEKVVQAEFSRDPALLELYASGEKHDVYLYNAMDIHPNPEFRRMLKEEYKCDEEVIATLKKKYKKERSFIKPACIAEGTPIRVKGHGFKPIESITSSDIIWDGESWVSCDGVVCNGIRNVIELNNTLLTADHKIKTHEGWINAEEVRRKGWKKVSKKAERPSGSWAEVWQLGSSILRNKAREWVQVCSSKLWKSSSSL